jgi:CTP:molybdopterin cytidylyltransferase MocA
MARAQKLRWKKIKQSSEASQAAVKPKRHMNASARKRIAAAQKKRWAVVKKAAERPAVAKKTTRKKATATPETSATAGA